MRNLNVNAIPFEPFDDFTILNCDLKNDVAPGGSASSVPSAEVIVADKGKEHCTEDFTITDGKEEDYAGKDKDFSVLDDFMITKGGKASKKKKSKHKRKK